ncbi:DUF2971 domain-containing protein, partial [Vibrio anguillarum]|nr:DUF2971 domain-containing protein [Vibrio anguillarum]
LDLRSNEIQKDNGLLFMPFSKELKLVRAYSGLRCNLTQEDKVMFLKRDIPLVNMTQNPKSYTLVPEA